MKTKKKAESLSTPGHLIDIRKASFVPGATFWHYTGKTYTAIMFVHEHDTRKLRCVYYAHDTQEGSVRDIEDFFQDVFWDGVVQARFVRVPAVLRT